jgi:hypothetical protein
MPTTMAKAVAILATLGGVLGAVGLLPGQAVLQTLAENATRVQVELYVMSRCPDAVRQGSKHFADCSVFAR